MSQTASWTCFILLPNKQKSIPLALAIAWDFPAQCIQKPQRRKSHAHHEELVNVIGKTQTFCQAAFRASNTKTNMTNGIQLLTVAVFFTGKCASFSLKMQHMKWYEWVRCGSWRLQGCDLGYKTVWPIPQWKTRSSTSMKAIMNFGTGTSECSAESLNGSWQMRWPACFMRIWNCRSQKDLRRSYPSHVHVLLFVKPDPGHAIGEEPATFVGTGTCGHSQLKVSTKANIWSLLRLAWLSRLSTLSELYTPKKQVWDLTSWKHDTTCEASICLVNC